MDLKKTVVSPNYTDIEIPVEYVVVHYTAATLERTLEIFSDESRQVSSHLVIGRKGEVYETVPCLTRRALRAWHAGSSKMSVREGSVLHSLEGFNDFSIGIELVNPNGNVFPFTEQQYLALQEVLVSIKEMYPSISTPERIVGHEEIAGFRGKCDPGIQFDWARALKSVFPGATLEQRQSVCDQRTAGALMKLYSDLGVRFDPVSHEVEGLEGVSPGVLEGISTLLEAAIGAGSCTR